ncbi:Ribosomal large subunit pseudouridine synthase B [Phaeobacter sp. CECT 5382]|uniref:pseudouridine synthase n=1 Tax=Phaeobacter sp. CECT 5382 TaxID=1712645 RepID=UPI0006D94348|nr:pseudouridine synthase [Phaeobacter sp. CECT 5382]CUH87192.1 Ribosomal large subunit pseudouridine synthase B [Phaeobacter sp. CECT 5382]
MSKAPGSPTGKAFPKAKASAKPAAKVAAKAAPKAPAKDDAAPTGDRIAKVLSRAGVASRREAERMIAEGRVKVNGTQIDSPALNVTDRDRIIVDGKPLPQAEAPRLWLYNKPAGLVTSNSDEKGRRTIFDALPEDLPRVMTVGRLDLNSEGLLLLTNDGGIKRRLELPSTGWLRRYRVRINGRPKDEDFEPLRKGLVVDGERFQPMTVALDRQQGANAWLTIGLREGKNREIRRALEDIGYTVNRLLRLSYGPFQLGSLKLGEVEELRPRVVRDQLGLEAEDMEEKPAPRPQRGKPGHKAGGKPAGKPSGRPVGKPSGKPAGKFGGRSEGRSDDRSSARPSARSGEKPGFTSKARSGGKPGQNTRNAQNASGNGPRRDGAKPGSKGPSSNSRPIGKNPRR